jgi:hypothetical protein
MPSPATEKWPWSNNHPGLIGKRACYTKTEVATEKAARETETVIAAAACEQAMDMLAVIEIEQAERDTSQWKAVTCKHPGAKASWDVPAEGSSDASMGIDKDIAKPIDQEMEADEKADEDDDDLKSHQSDVEKVTAKKVGVTSCMITLESNPCCYSEAQFQEMRIVEGSHSQEGNSAAKGHSTKAVHHMFDHQSHISSLS